MFQWSLNTAHCLLILDCLGRNICSGTATQMDGLVQMFDPLHYDKLNILLT